MNNRIVRWLLLLTGLVMAYTAHRAVLANEAIISVQAVLVGALAVFAWTVLFRDRSLSGAENRSH